MKFLLLALMVAACGQQPAGETKGCLRSSSLQNDGSGGGLGCLKPSNMKPTPFKGTVVFFSQLQDNGQSCLYQGRFGKQAEAVTKFSVAADDVYTALQAQHLAKQIMNTRVGAVDLVLPTYLFVKAIRQAKRCGSGEFLYDRAGDILQGGNLAEHSERLSVLCGKYGAAKLISSATTISEDEQYVSTLAVADKIFQSEKPVIFLPKQRAILLKHMVKFYRDVAYDTISDSKKAAIAALLVKNRLAIQKIKQVQSWVHSDGATVCSPQQASI